MDSTQLVNGECYVYQKTTMEDCRNEYKKENNNDVRYINCHHDCYGWLLASYAVESK